MEWKIILWMLGILLVILGVMLVPTAVVGASAIIFFGIMLMISECEYEEEEA